MVNKKVIKEGFAVQTPSPKPGIDPMCEKLGPEQPNPISMEQKEFWNSFLKELKNQQQINFIITKIIYKSTRAQITLANKVNGFIKSIVIYQDWEQDGNTKNPTTVVQIETEDGDKVKKIGKLAIIDPEDYAKKINVIINQILKEIEKEDVFLKEDNQLSDVKVKKGKMHKILNIPEDKDVEDIYKSGEELVKVLVKKVGEKKATEMINFAANINSKKNIFDSAQKALKKIEEKAKSKSQQITTESNKTKLKIALLKEQLGKLTGKKVILKEGIERVTIEQMNNILSNLPSQEKIALYMITKVGMNKNIIDANGNKTVNPFYDKVLKKNIVYGRVNFNYGEEFKGATGQDYVANPNSKRTLGVKQGAISIKDGKTRLPLVDIEYDTPTYEVNGNEISKEELKPYLRLVNLSSNKEPITMIAPNLENVKKIAIGTKEYQII